MTELGINRFLAKPFRIDELLGAIQELCGTAKSAAEEFNVASVLAD